MPTIEEKVVQLLNTMEDLCDYNKCIDCVLWNNSNSRCLISSAHMQLLKYKREHK